MYSPSILCIWPSYEFDHGPICSTLKHIGQNTGYYERTEYRVLREELKTVYQENHHR